MAKKPNVTTCPLPQSRGGRPPTPGRPSMPGSQRSQSPFDPAKDRVFERQMVESMQDRLRDALLRLELREEEIRDLRKRNAHLELELKRQGRELTIALKDNIVLKQQAKRQKQH